jgi:hypothetical protein
VPNWWCDDPDRPAEMGSRGASPLDLRDRTSHTVRMISDYQLSRQLFVLLTERLLSARWACLKSIYILYPL